MRWDIDILVRIFKNYFTFLELTCVLAHVCRRWRAACCDLTFWNTLDLSHMRSSFIKIPQEPYVYVESRSDKQLTRTLKLSMSLSKRNTRTLIFNYNLLPTADMGLYTAKRCPDLRRLVLPGWYRLMKNKGLFNAIRFCKNLESLTMPSIPHPNFVFSSIAKNCKNFRELKEMGPIELLFAQNLVQILPNIKVLSLRCNSIDRDALIKILDELKSLEVLNISHSYLVVQKLEKNKKKLNIVKEVDDEIMDKASKLRQFVTCMKHETCVMCQRTEKDEGIMRWYKYEEGLWKADEINSLHL
ncbi:hypothetical protein EUTSA_v10005421mg [Eutrema salsugineum]|uniref:F-box domain-containing protein n=2 Tax=Eutrema salsugineum TaxID=72664 RepID=V4MKH2_EUTSA|nr:hypothetical protein EUTSA_v10005421mg [Eutrema salsugineum]